MNIRRTNYEFHVIPLIDGKESVVVNESKSLHEAESYIKKQYTERCYSWPYIVRIYDKNTDMYASIKFQYRYHSVSIVESYIENDFGY